MRRKLFSKPRDETEDVVQIIHSLEKNEILSTREAVIAKLMNIKKINEDTAKANIDCALCLGAIVSIYNNNNIAILKDVINLKQCRSLVLKHSMDFSDIIIKTLKELNAFSKAMSRSVSDIENHITSTYNVKSQNLSLLSILVQKYIQILQRRNIIVSNPDVENVAHCYFLLPDEKDKINGDSKHHNEFHDVCYPSTSCFDDCLTNGENCLKNNCSENSVSKKRDKLRNKTHRLSLQTNQSHTKGELKQLQDSLSQFFTPSHVRRSRLASLNNIESTSRIQSNEFLLENDTNKALEIVIDEPSVKVSGQLTGSSVDSIRSPTGSSTTSSPHRRHDRLQDALSSYFQVNNERRKRHEKGEYLLMSNGTTPRRKLDSSNVSNDSIMGVENIKPIPVKEELTIVKNENSESARISPGRSFRTPRSQTGSENRKFTLRNSSSVVRKDSRRSLAGERANQLLKRACDRAIVRQNNISSPTDSPNKNRSPHKPVISPYKSKSNAKRQVEPASFIRVQTEPSSTLRPLSTPVVSSVANSFKTSDSSKDTFETIWDIPEEDREMFNKAREITLNNIMENNKIIANNHETRAFPARININNFEIESWYSSPYPQEYVGLPILYICEACLAYLTDRSPHTKKCKAVFPPGNEIYRNKNISIFEVDGNLARVYCRNLCLLAKLFIDHKTLYFDVEPFFFYVMTVNDDKGSHFVGYFSKEKFSTQKYNLACIVTLPCYQGKGYGNFLIDFSFLLTRREKMVGTPERPLSDLGQIAYQSYWRNAIFEYLYENFIIDSEKNISIYDISLNTGICASDVLDLLSSNKMFKVVNSNLNVIINVNKLKKHWNRAKSSKSRIWIDETKLNWSPKKYSPVKENTSRLSDESTAAEVPIKTTFVQTKKTNVRNKRSTAVRRVFNECNTGILSAVDEESNSMAELSATQAKKSEARKNRITKYVSKNNKANNSTFLSDDEDVEFIPRNKKPMSCKNDITKKYVRRKTPSSDEELDPKDRNIRSTFNKSNSRAASASSIRAAKSKRFSKSDTKKKTKYITKFVESEDLSDAYELVPKISKTTQKRKNNRKINNYSSSEENDSIVSNDSDSTSEYEGPKRKNSSFQVRNKKINNGKTANSTKSTTNSTVKKKRENLTKLENQSTSINKKSKEVGIKNTNALESKVTEKPSTSIDKSKKVKQVKRKWKTSDSSDISDNDQNLSDDRKPHNNNKKMKNKLDKRYSRGFFRRQPGRLYQQNSSEDDEHDEICSSSSMSPQPLGDRIAMKTSLQQEPETINMGGEPDTINMGGEPDDDGLSALIVQNVFSPKAPLAPPANFEPNVEEDENQNENIASTNQESFNVSGHNHISPACLLSQQFSNPILKNFDDSLELQNQHIDNINEILCISTQRSQSFNVGQMYDNYICSTSNTANLPLQEPYMNSVKNIEHNTLHSHLNSFQSYYMQQHEPCSTNDNHNVELQQSISLKTMAEQNLDNIKKQITEDPDCLISSAEDKGASDMPILDARFTPIHSPPSMDHAQVATKLEEDDDDAPPKLSPNPITELSSDNKKIEDLPVMESVNSLVNSNSDSSANDSVSNLHNESSLSNLSLANVSYDSVRSSGSQKLAQTPGSNVNLLNTAGMPTLPAQENSLLQQTHVSSSNYNLNQMHLEVSHFQTTSNDYDSFQMYSNSSNTQSTVDHQSNNNSLGIVNSVQTNTIVPSTSYENNYEIFSPTSQIKGSTTSQACTISTNVLIGSSPNAVVNSQSVKNDVISPKTAQLNSNVPHLIPQQLQPEINGFEQQQHSNDQQQSLINYMSMNVSGYLPPPTLTAAELPTNVAETSKKAKKTTKEKTTKVIKRPKATAEMNHLPTNSTLKGNQAPSLLPPNLQFMSMSAPFMSDYMMPNMHAAMTAQFSLVNGANQMGFNPAGAPNYYSPGNYFNLSTTSANAYSQHQYLPMASNSFYSNSAAWSQYYGSYPPAAYPSLNRNTNTQLPNSSNVDNIPRCGSSSSALSHNDAMIASVPGWPMPMMNPSAFSNNVVNCNSTTDNSASLAGATVAANVAAAATASGSFYPQSYGNNQYQNLHHLNYSSYSAHT